MPLIEISCECEAIAISVSAHNALQFWLFCANKCVSCGGLVVVNEPYKKKMVCNDNFFQKPFKALLSLTCTSFKREGRNQEFGILLFNQFH